MALFPGPGSSSGIGEFEPGAERDKLDSGGFWGPGSTTGSGDCDGMLESKEELDGLHFDGEDGDVGSLSCSSDVLGSIVEKDTLCGMSGDSGAFTFVVLAFFAGGFSTSNISSGSVVDLCFPFLLVVGGVDDLSAGSFCSS